ncbi:protein kinase domain-containing protein [Melittangium boletus]|uniref:protein kinase domain-containing protein n=1 Tax=Melittangium boletus TaxID=83453 RepID=UPI003DA40F35
MTESRYRLVRSLAMGGMAELFLGISRGAEGFEKPVAIKRLLPHLAREPHIARMFLNEARLATHLHHQNIASVYDVGRGAEGLFLVMELVDGWDLGVLQRHAAQRGVRFPPHLVAFIGTQVLAGLVHAYRRLYEGRPVLAAHRDISPSNLLVSREGEVKVTDFGIARVEGLSTGTQPGTFRGKMPYAAPETLRGEPATAASDQFSLGIVLYELLAGRHPFAHDAREPLALALAISQREPAPLEDVPAPLGAVVLKALARDAQDRFARPEDMADALARVIAQLGEPTQSRTLAAFITRLDPPPPLLDRDVPTVPHDDRTHTSERPSLTLPAVSASFELQLSDEWTPPPGPALSASGQVLQGTPPPGPPPDPVRPAPVRPAPVMYEQTFDWSAPPVGGAPREPTGSGLELEERAPHPPSDFRSPLEPSPLLVRLGRVARTGLLLLLGAGGLWLAAPHARSLGRALWPRVRQAVGLSPRVHMLSITSEPPQATVYVDGVELGTTPLFVDNVYPERDLPVRLTLKGYKPWKGTLRGGEPVTLDVRLQR